MLNKSAANHFHGGIKAALHNIEEGLKFYGTMRGAFEAGKGILAAGRAAYAFAAPLAAALL